MSDQTIVKEPSKRAVRRVLVHPQNMIYSQGQQNTLPANHSDAWSRKSIRLLPILKEEVIFESVNQCDDHLKGRYSKLTLKNLLHRITNSSRTIAHYTTLAGRTEVKTSNRLVNLIGQQNYDAVFVALCSVISQELKIRAILALLTTEKQTKEASCQTDNSMESYGTNTMDNVKVKVKRYAEASSQTIGVPHELFNKKKAVIKRKVTSFVVKSDIAPTQPKVNRIYINPHSKEDCQLLHEEDTKNSDADPKVNHGMHGSKVNTDPDSKLDHRMLSLPELKPFLIDEDSITSNISLSNMSVCSEILQKQENNLLNKIDCNIKQSETAVTNCPPPDLIKNTPKKSEAEMFAENPTPIQLFDGTTITVQVKPEDQFHLITADILRHLSADEKKKLIQHQAYIDYKLCLETNEDGYMPIHLAVLNDDVPLIRRQGVVLKHRGKSVDVTTKEGLTPLALAILGRSLPCVTSLLQLGADPLQTSGEQSPLHLAAEAPAEYMRAVLVALTTGARRIISEHEELQHPGLEGHSEEELARHLMLETSVMFDSNGYTPLMLASRLGHHQTVQLLVDRAPETVNTARPDCGQTALFEVVAEACARSSEDNSRTVPEDFLKTVQILIDNGADPEIENRSGTKVFDLLANTYENHENSLSLLISQRMTAKHYDGEIPTTLNIASYMLVNEKGKVSLVENTSKPNRKRQIEGGRKTDSPQPSDNKRQTDSSRASDSKRQTDSPRSSDSKRQTDSCDDARSQETRRKRQIQGTGKSQNDSKSGSPQPSCSKRRTDTHFDDCSHDDRNKLRQIDTSNNDSACQNRQTDNNFVSPSSSANVDKKDERTKPVILANVAINKNSGDGVVLPTKAIIYPTALVVNNRNKMMLQSERLPARRPVLDGLSTIDKPSNIILHKGNIKTTSKKVQNRKSTKIGNKMKFIKILPKVSGSIDDKQTFRKE